MGRQGSGPGEAPQEGRWMPEKRRPTDWETLFRLMDTAPPLPAPGPQPADEKTEAP